MPLLGLRHGPAVLGRARAWSNVLLSSSFFESLTLRAQETSTHFSGFMFLGSSQQCPWG